MSDHLYPLITEDQSEKYVEDGGQECPLCSSDEIEAPRGPEIEGGSGWQETRCLKCGAVWQDIYHLVAASNEFTRDRGGMG